MKPSSFRRASGGALLCAAALAACSDQPVAPVADHTSQDLKERVSAMGFRPDMIVDEGDHFRVEGDIIISKRDLAGPRLSRSPDDPRHQYYTNSLISQSKMVSGITVNLSGIASSSVWTNAARAALQAWSGTYGSKVYFTESSSADITFSFGTLPSNVYAQASFPTSGGNPGATVTINSSTPPVDQNQKRWIMVHELGHTIGFRHTNWSALGESAGPAGANQVPGTPSGNDNSSVFRGGLSSVPSWSYFSSNDQVAYKYLYPAPAPSITSQGFSSGHPSFSWVSVTYATSYRVAKTVYLYEFIFYDPRVSDDGYWGYVGYPYPSTTVSGVVTFTDTSANAVTDGSCYTEYGVGPKYTSTKVGAESLVTFDAC